MESYNNIIGIVGLVIIMVLFMFNGEILVNFMGYMLNALFAFADSLAVAGQVKIMFKLYYFFKSSTVLVYQNDDLAPCLQYIKSKNYTPRLCTIISPNNRRITFNEYNDMVFSA